MARAATMVKTGQHAEYEAAVDVVLRHISTKRAEHRESLLSVAHCKKLLQSELGVGLRTAGYIAKHLLAMLVDMGIVSEFDGDSKVVVISGSADAVLTTSIYINDYILSRPEEVGIDGSRYTPAMKARSSEASRGHIVSPATRTAISKALEAYHRRKASLVD